MIRGTQNQTKGKNTGKSTQVFNPDIMVGSWLVPFNWNMAVAPGDTDATILANLLASIGGTAASPGVLINANYPNRAFYFGPFEQFDDKSEAPTEQTLGYGKKIDTFRGIYNFDYTFDEGGLDYFLSVLSFRGKNKQFKWVPFDAKGAVYCTKEFDNNGNIIGIQGIELSRLYPKDWMIGDTKKEALYGLSVSLADSAEINENLFVVTTNMDLKSYSEGYGIQDVYLNVPLTAGVPTPIVYTVGTLAVTALLAGGQINLESSLAAIGSPANWAATNATTGASVTITSITATPGVFTFLFDTTTLATMHTAGQKLVLKMLNVPALGVTGYEWYESNTVTIALT